MKSKCGKFLARVVGARKERGIGEMGRARVPGQRAGRRFPAKREKRVRSETVSRRAGLTATCRKGKHLEPYIVSCMKRNSENCCYSSILIFACFKGRTRAAGDKGARDDRAPRLLSLHYNAHL